MRNTITTSVVKVILRIDLDLVQGLLINLDLREVRSRPSQKRMFEYVNLDLNLSDEEGSRPSTSSSRPASESRSRPASESRSRPKSTSSSQAKRSTEWKEVQADDEVYPQNFCFTPNRAPGVHAALNYESSPLDCFQESFDGQMIFSFIDSINTFAEQRVAEIH